MPTAYPPPTHTSMKVTTNITPLSVFCIYALLQIQICVSDAADVIPLVDSSVIVPYRHAGLQADVAETRHPGMFHAENIRPTASNPTQSTCIPAYAPCSDVGHLADDAPYRCASRNCALQRGGSTTFTYRIYTFVPRIYVSLQTYSFMLVRGERCPLPCRWCYPRCRDERLLLSATDVPRTTYSPMARNEPRKHTKRHRTGSRRLSETTSLCRDRLHPTCATMLELFLIFCVLLPKVAKVINFKIFEYTATDLMLLIFYIIPKSNIVYIYIASSMSCKMFVRVTTDKNIKCVTTYHIILPSNASPRQEGNASTTSMLKNFIYPTYIVYIHRIIEIFGWYCHQIKILMPYNQRFAIASVLKTIYHLLCIMLTSLSFSTFYCNCFSMCISTRVNIDILCICIFGILQSTIPVPLLIHWISDGGLDRTLDSSCEGSKKDRLTKRQTAPHKVLTGPKLSNIHMYNVFGVTCPNVCPYLVNSDENIVCTYLRGSAFQACPDEAVYTRYFLYHNIVSLCIKLCRSFEITHQRAIIQMMFIYALSSTEVNAYLYLIHVKKNFRECRCRQSHLMIFNTFQYDYCLLWGFFYLFPIIGLIEESFKVSYALIIALSQRKVNNDTNATYPTVSRNGVKWEMLLVGRYHPTIDFFMIYEYVTQCTSLYFFICWSETRWQNSSWASRSGRHTETPPATTKHTTALKNKNLPCGFCALCHNTRHPCDGQRLSKDEERRFSSVVVVRGDVSYMHLGILHTMPYILIYVSVLRTNELNTSYQYGKNARAKYPLRYSRLNFSGVSTKCVSFLCIKVLLLEEMYILNSICPVHHKN